MLSSDVPLETDIGSILLKSSSRSAENDPNYVIIDTNTVKYLTFEPGEPLGDNCNTGSMSVLSEPPKTNIPGIEIAVHRIKELINKNVNQCVINNGMTLLK